MATLSGNKIKNTYQSLVKFSDNGNITVGAKQLTDGFGNNSPMWVSTTQVGIGVTPESGLNLHVFGDAKIGSNLTVIGNLVVEGSTTTVGTDTLTVKDPLIVLANNNTSTDAVDIGFYGKYTPSGTTLYSGLFREALTGKYRLFKDLQVEPTTTVNTSGTGYAQADLILGDLDAQNVDVTTTLTTSQFLASHYITLTTAGSDTVINGIRHQHSNKYFNFQLGASGGLKSFIYDGVNPRINWLSVDTSGNATFSGNIILSGTVDGRDVATDGAKLDGIEAGADVTDATNVLAAGAVMTTGNQSISGVKTFSDQVTIPATPSASTDAASKGYVDSAIGDNNELSEVLANGNTTGGTDIDVSAGDDVTFADDSKAIFGAGNDLEIYHDGASSYIKDVGTGSLNILGSGSVRIKGSTNDEFMGRFNENGSVQLYYDNVEKLATTSTGISVSGTSSTFAGNVNTGRLFVEQSGADMIDMTRTGVGTYRFAISGGDSFSLFDVGANADRLIIDSSGNVGIGTDSPNNLLNLQRNVAGGDVAAYIQNFNADAASTDETASVIFAHGNDGNVGYVGGKVVCGKEGDFETSIPNIKGNLQFYTASGTSLDSNVNNIERMRIDGSGNVGIGTDSPSSEISGSVTMLEINDATNNNLASLALQAGTAGSKWEIGALVSNALGFFDDGTERMRIDNSGNVGIGGTLANKKLYVLGDTTNYQILAEQPSGYAGLSIKSTTVAQTWSWIANDNGSNSDLLLYGGSSAGTKLTIDSSGQIIFKGTGNGIDLRFKDISAAISSETAGYIGMSTSAYSGNNGDLVLIPRTSSASNILLMQGNVGIGTESPVNKLDIRNGELTVRPSSSGNGGLGKIGYSSNNSIIQLYDSSGNEDVRISTSLSSYFNGGNVGIGTDSPLQKLHLEEAGATSVYAEWSNNSRANNAYMGLTVAGQLAIQNNTSIKFDTGASYTERMRIDSSGNVGIGVTPESWATVGDTKAIQFSTGGALWEAYNGVFLSNNIYFDGNNKYIASQAAARLGLSSTGELQFLNAPSGTADTNVSLAERMRIDSGGHLSVSSRGAFAWQAYNFHSFENNSANEPVAVFYQTGSVNYGINVLLDTDHNNTTSRFFMGAGASGSNERIKIYSNGNIQNSNNSYGQLSDRKLKENIEDATPKLDDLMQVQIKNFNYIGEDNKQIGVIAQELEEIFPTLIYETPDTERQDINKTDEEGNIIYQTEEILISEAVKGQDAIEWEDKPTTDNTKVEIQTWLDDNEIEWQNADTKQELLDRIPEYQQEAVMPKDAVYETRETDEPVIENKEVDLGTTTKAVKYSVFVPMLIKGMQEQQQLINDLKNRIETLENN